MGTLSNEAEIKQVPANINFHSFNANIAERLVRFEVMKFKDSIYLWIGDSRCRSFGDLSLAITSKYSKEPDSTKIIGKSTNMTSVHLANKLSKKLGKAVYVSYNLPDDRLTVPVVNQRISEEIKTNAQYF